MLAGHNDCSVSSSPERRQRFESLASLVFDPLQRYLRRRLDPEDASDVLSETLLVVWRRLDEVPKDNPLPWCYGVARRAAANQRRSRRRHLRLVERIERERPTPTVEPGFDDPVLEAAFDGLSESDRELLRLWAWEGLEPREIATVLGLTVNATTLRLSRARKKLAAEMTRQDPIAAGQKTVRHTKEQQQ